MRKNKRFLFLVRYIIEVNWFVIEKKIIILNERINFNYCQDPDVSQGRYSVCLMGSVSEKFQFCPVPNKPGLTTSSHGIVLVEWEMERSVYCCDLGGNVLRKVALPCLE